MDTLQNLERKLEQAAQEVGLQPNHKVNSQKLHGEVRLPVDQTEQGDEGKKQSAKSAIDALLTSERVLRPLRSLLLEAYIANPRQFSMNLGELLAELLQEEQVANNDPLFFEEKLVAMSNYYLQVDMLEGEIANLLSTCSLVSSVDKAEASTPQPHKKKKNNKVAERRVETRQGNMSTHHDKQQGVDQSDSEDNDPLNETIIFWKTQQARQGGGLKWTPLRNYYTTKPTKNGQATSIKSKTSSKSTTKTTRPNGENNGKTGLKRKVRRKKKRKDEGLERLMRPTMSSLAKS